MPIIEVPLDHAEQIGDVGEFLFENGIYVTLAAYPLVPRSEVGFRIQLTAANTDGEVDRLIEVLGLLADPFDLHHPQNRPHDAPAHHRPRRAGRSGPLPRRAGGLTAAYLFVPPFKGYAVVVNVIGVSSLVAIAAGIRAARPKARVAWGLILLGQTLYVAGDFYTYTYPDLLGGKVGFPSAGDAIYLSVYPALFAGLMLLVRRRDPHGRDRAAVRRLPRPHRRLRAPLLGLPVAPNMHLSGLTIAREDRLRRVPTRRRPAARRR